VKQAPFGYAIYLESFARSRGCGSHSSGGLFSERERHLTADSQRTPKRLLALARLARESENNAQLIPARSVENVVLRLK